MIGHIAEVERVLTDLAYSWQPAYTAATLETDLSTLSDRIQEALAAWLDEDPCEFTLTHA